MTVEVFPGNKADYPRTVVTIDTSRLGANSTGGTKALVVYGSAQSGIPNTVYHVSSYAQAKSVFKGGDLLDFIGMAWSPSNGTFQGAGDIYAVRVDTAKPATTEIGNLRISSKQYGQGANKVAVKLETGTLPNSYKLTAIDTSSSLSQEIYDNMGVIADIKYTGLEAVARLSVKDGILAINVGDTADALTPIISYDLSSELFSTMDKVVSQLNVTGLVEASFIPQGDKAIDSIFLDEVTDKDIKEEPYTVTSLVGSMLHETLYSDLIEVNLIKEVAPKLVLTPSDTEVLFEEEDSQVLPPVTTFPIRQLVGGSNGTVPGSWDSLFRLLQTNDTPSAYYIVPLTPNQAIHRELSAFVTEMSGTGFPMRGIVGGGLGENINKTFARKAVLNNPRIALVGFDTKTAMPDGRIATMPAYMTSAYVAGLASGLPVGEAITYKPLNIVGLNRDYTSDELSTLSSAGVVVAKKERNNTGQTFRVLSDVTTANNENDPVQSKMSLGELSDFLGNSMREMLDSKFIGTRTTSVTASTLKAEISTFLLEKKNQGRIVAYNPADISVSVTGNQANITCVVEPSRELEYINVGIIYDTSTQSV